MCGKIRQDAQVHRMTDRERVHAGVVQCCEKFGGRGCAHGGSGAAHVVRITAREWGCVAYISVIFVFYQVNSFLSSFFPAGKGWGAHYSKHWVALPAAEVRGKTILCVFV